MQFVLFLSGLILVVLSARVAVRGSTATVRSLFGAGIVLMMLGAGMGA